MAYLIVVKSIVHRDMYMMMPTHIQTHQGIAIVVFVSIILIGDL